MVCFFPPRAWAHWVRNRFVPKLTTYFERLAPAKEAMSDLTMDMRRCAAEWTMNMQDYTYYIYFDT